MSEARKLAAILVADVVGYNRLAGADEEFNPDYPDLYKNPDDFEKMVEGLRKAGRPEA